MKRIPFSQVLKTAAIDIRREYDRLYGMFCVQKFQDMVGAGSSLKDYCATYFVRLPFRGTCVSLDDFDDFYGYSFEKNPSTFDIEYLVSFCEYSYNLAIYNQNTIYGKRRIACPTILIKAAATPAGSSSARSITPAGS